MPAPIRALVERHLALKPQLSVYHSRLCRAPADTPYWEEPPICGVRQVDGQPVAAWMFCTDGASDTCAILDENGNPVHGFTGEQVGPMLPRPTNARLDDDQAKVVGYLLQHGIEWNANYPDYGGTATRADTASQPNRQALQRAV
ncbi:hypothetical protein [Prescottella sp. R16]|uniref:hypothetical protein n=1 Tax=Prescottella sp. R16 TaxID=3064529 RepID=UPI00272E3695|nr:hypothetical protein [Prescottella sp. R16]